MARLKTVTPPHRRYWRARIKVLDVDEYEYDRARQDIGWGAGIKNLFRNLLP